MLQWISPSFPFALLGGLAVFVVSIVVLLKRDDRRRVRAEAQPEARPEAQPEPGWIIEFDGNDCACEGCQEYRAELTERAERAERAEEPARETPADTTVLASELAALTALEVDDIVAQVEAAAVALAMPRDPWGEFRGASPKPKKAKKITATAPKTPKKLPKKTVAPMPAKRANPVKKAAAKRRTK